MTPAAALAPDRPPRLAIREVAARRGVPGAMFPPPAGHPALAVLVARSAHRT